MKKTIILVFICSLPLLSNAQVSSYIIGGTSHAINLSEISQPGYNFGVLFDFPFSKSWSFQTGLNYNYIASDSNWDVTRYVGGVQNAVFDEGSYSTYSFLEIPACISLKFKLSERTNLRFNTGAFMGIFTGGNYLLRTSTGFSDYVLYRSYADPVNLGFLFGTGIEINKIYLGIEGNINATSYIPEGAIKTKLGIRF
jgi:hypothetical protein